MITQTSSNKTFLRKFKRKEVIEMKHKGIPLIVSVLVLFVLGSVTFAGPDRMPSYQYPDGDKRTIVGRVFAPEIFIDENGKNYVISDANIGKRLMQLGERLFQLGDMDSSRVRVTGTVKESQGKMVIDITEYQKITCEKRIVGWGNRGAKPTFAYSCRAGEKFEVGG